ncbi:MAG: SRPBCC family protein [Myxococcota bacterium]
MEIERSFIANVSVDRAWAVLGDNFHDVAAWSSGIKVSRRLAGVGPAGVADRQCEVPGFGTITERLGTFDAQTRTFAYEVIEGAPSFATHMGNRWSLEAAGAEQTRISFKIRTELKPLAGFLMGWMLKRQMNKLCDEVCDDLKVFLETGKPSQSKLEAA